MSDAIEGPDLQLLPPLLRDFVDAIGVEKTLRVVEHCAGQRTYFAREPGPEHWLSQLIGQDEARKLGRVCTSEAVVVPKASAALRDIRDRRFVARRDETSLATAAREFGLARRTAQTIQAKHRQRHGDAGEPTAGQQPRLFE